MSTSSLFTAAVSAKACIASAVAMNIGSVAANMIVNDVNAMANVMCVNAANIGNIGCTSAEGMCSEASEMI